MNSSLGEESVATYSTARQEYAEATQQHLIDQGFEVMPLAEWRGNYLVLVGAAPEVDDLRAVRARLTRLDSWDGTPGAYADAYIEKIDDLVDR